MTSPRSEAGGEGASTETWGARGVDEGGSAPGGRLGDAPAAAGLGRGLRTTEKPFSPESAAGASNGGS